VWRDVGLLAETHVVASLEARRQEVRRHALATDDGLEVFRRAVASRRTQVVVSPRELNVVLDEATHLVDDRAAPRSVSAGAAAVNGSASRESLDEIERSVSAAWTDALGFAPEDADASFLALGGHSLMAMRIVAQLRATWGVDFTLRQFFARPTITGHTQAIRAAVSSAGVGHSTAVAEVSLP
jgi:aryl carrier-like protein